MEQLYRSVKISVRLPIVLIGTKEFYVKIDDYKSIAVFNSQDKYFYSNSIKQDVSEWLEPIESKEFKDLPDNYKDESDLGNEFNSDRKSTRLNSSHANISYAVFCLK